MPHQDVRGPRLGSLLGHLLHPVENEKNPHQLHPVENEKYLHLSHHLDPNQLTLMMALNHLLKLAKVLAFESKMKTSRSRLRVKPIKKRVS
tara:strand:+ start:510 stop:782 length:273 start_codon:yes stop_codon:yes gene_type:complete